MLTVTIHRAGNGTCSLTGKDGEGIAITFDDGTVKNQFLSWKAFRQLLAIVAHASVILMLRQVVAAPI